MDYLFKQGRIAPLGTGLIVGAQGTVRVFVRAHLPEQAPVLPEVEPVVGGEDDHRLLRKAHILHPPQQKAQPGVHHGDFAAVGGVALAHPGFFVPGHVVPVPVDGQHQFAVVLRQVKLGVVGGGVPGFVRVPGVHVEKEGFLVVLFQPAHGAHEGLRRVPVGFVPPGRPHVQRFIVVAGFGYQRPQGVLAPVEEEGLEPSVVVHSVPQVVGGVHRGGGVVAVSRQDFGQGGYAGRQGFPAHEGHGPPARLVVGPGGHGGKASGVMAVKAHRAGGQGIQGGSFDPGIAVGPDVIATKGVRNHPDNVHTGTP